METITLGQSSIAVPPLCIGTWAWGDKLFWSYGSDYDEKKLKEAFNAALEAGTTFFDTAEIYGLGLSEELLGQFMKQSDRSAILQLNLALYLGDLPLNLSQMRLQIA